MGLLVDSVVGEGDKVIGGATRLECRLVDLLLLALGNQSLKYAKFSSDCVEGTPCCRL